MKKVSEDAMNMFRSTGRKIFNRIADIADGKSTQTIKFKNGDSVDVDRKIAMRIVSAWSMMTSGQRVEFEKSLKTSEGLKQTVASYSKQGSGIKQKGSSEKGSRKVSRAMMDPVLGEDYRSMDDAKNSAKNSADAASSFDDLNKRVSNIYYRGRQADLAQRRFAQNNKQARRNDINNKIMTRAGSTPNTSDFNLDNVKKSADQIASARRTGAGTQGSALASRQALKNPNGANTSQNMNNQSWRGVGTGQNRAADRMRSGTKAANATRGQSSGDAGRTQTTRGTTRPSAPTGAAGFKRDAQDFIQQFGGKVDPDLLNTRKDGYRRNDGAIFPQMDPDQIVKNLGQDALNVAPMPAGAALGALGRTLNRFNPFKRTRVQPKTLPPRNDTLELKPRNRVATRNPFTKRPPAVKPVTAPNPVKRGNNTTKPIDPMYGVQYVDDIQARTADIAKPKVRVPAGSSRTASNSTSKERNFGQSFAQRGTGSAASQSSKPAQTSRFARPEPKADAPERNFTQAGSTNKYRSSRNNTGSTPAQTSKFTRDTQLDPEIENNINAISNMSPEQLDKFNSEMEKVLDNILDNFSGDKFSDALANARRIALDKALGRD